MIKLTVNDLACRRGDHLVFEGVSLVASGGDVIALTGPNGVGKTSLLRLLAGLLRPEAGSVALHDGADGLSEFPAQSTHFCGPLDAIKPTFTVDETLAFWQRFLGGGRDETVRDRALAALGLVRLRDLPGAVLSSGQRRRVSLARLLVVDRPVWLLDEPTNGLDGAAQEQLRGMISAHVAGGGIAIVATHAALELPNVRVLQFDTPSDGSVPDRQAVA